mmetsp:Transcript_10877/g.24696  ORF Transcript_10877/g.24696 Transcript_10877/m.24696 type:complete len:252 (-) Transcript_10877:8-763(-)
MGDDGRFNDVLTHLFELLCQLLHPCCFPYEAILKTGLSDNGILGNHISRPSPHLSLHIVTNFAEAFEPNLFVFHRVQLSQNPNDVLVESCAITFAEALKPRSFAPFSFPPYVIEYSTLHELHEVKVLAQHSRILAQKQHLWNWHTRPSECFLYSKLAVYLMGSRQKLSRWLLPQDVLLTCGALDEVCWVGGTVVKLFNFKPATTKCLHAIWKCMCEIRLEFVGIDWLPHLNDIFGTTPHGAITSTSPLSLT